MEKLKKLGIVFVMVLLVSGTTMTVSAKQKLKVNTLYETVRKTQAIKGKAKKGATITVKAYKKKNGKYKYKWTGKANKKTGKFTVYIPVEHYSDYTDVYSAGKKIKVTAKKGKWKKTKTIKVKNWWKQKSYKKHKASVASGNYLTGSYGGKFDQFESKFAVYCKKGYYAIYTIAGKTYKVDATKKVQMYTIDRTKSVGTKGIKIKVYNAKTKRLVESYTQKSKIITVPKKNNPIDEKQVMKDYEKARKTGITIDKTIKKDDKYLYVYQVYPNGSMSIGCGWEWMKTEANGSHVTLKAKNGVTLYYTIWPNRGYDFPAPTLTKYDGVLKSGQTKKWQGSDFKKGELPDNNLRMKIYGYKDGKLVLIFASGEYLIQGFSDNAKYYVD